jgi:hypothetical protein
VAAQIRDRPDGGRPNSLSIGAICSRQLLAMDGNGLWIAFPPSVLTTAPRHLTSASLSTRGTNHRVASAEIRVPSPLRGASEVAMSVKRVRPRSFRCDGGAGAVNRRTLLLPVDAIRARRALYQLQVGKERLSAGQDLSPSTRMVAISEHA